MACIMGLNSELRSRMLYVVFFGLVLYVVLLITLLIGLQKTASKGVPADGKIHFISVVIAFRDEAGNLPALIECLASQDHPAFEVLLVDDHSQDNGPGLVSDWCKVDKRFKLIRQTGHGKKQAITEGIRASTGEIIATTDADCRFGNRWLSEISMAFVDDTVKLVCGPVHINHEGKFFGRLQQMEFASVMGTGMAAFGLGYPLYCNGANLAYRRDVFEELNGFVGNDHVVSGDDQFLLQKIRDKYSDGICFRNTENAFVTTKPQPSLRSFVHQRLRWAGKWSAGLNLPARVVAVAVVVVQCLFVFSWWIIATERNHLGLLIVAGMKMILEFVLISSVLQSAGQRTSVLRFLTLQILYPFYVIAIGIFSNFTSYSWKGRRHSPWQRSLAAK
jgi:biofilm PGA synthesis N-glycosyltransferase PgaC